VAGSSRRTPQIGLVATIGRKLALRRCCAQLVAREMKFSLSEISQAIAEELQEANWRDVGDPDYHKPQAEVGPYADGTPYPDGDDFFSDREAHPHDDSMYGDPEGGWPEESTLKVAADNLMEVHSLLEKELDSGDYEMHEEQKIDQISEVAYSMYQQLMHIIEGSMSE
jgi:hypothetical protein